MRHDAIQLVGEEICKRIVTSAPPLTIFFGPLDDLKAGDHDLVLFPYRISVSADLRNHEHEVAPDPLAGDQEHPRVYDEALPLEVRYLLAATRKAQGDWRGPAALGRAMQILNVDANIGMLVGGDIIHLSLDTTSAEEMGRIWAFFPAINYRTSVVYLATPVWIDPPSPRVTGAPVVHEKYRPWPKLEESA